MTDLSQLADGIFTSVKGYIARCLEPIIKRIDAIESRPAPVDGKNGRDGTNGKDGVNGKDGKNGLDGAPGRGIDGKDGRDGEKGEPGCDGKSITVDDVRSILEGEIAKGVLELERRATDAVQRAVDRLQQPKDGVNGRDGISLDDFDAKMDGRMLTLSMRCGDRTVERAIKLEIPMDKGIFRSGQSYEKSDVVTFGGSQWIALKDTNTKPPSDAWRLCVSKGKDGGDAK